MIKPGMILKVAGSILVLYKKEVDRNVDEKGLYFISKVCCFSKPKEIEMVLRANSKTNEIKSTIFEYDFNDT